MNWTNSLTVAGGNIQISNFDFQISNIYLDVGDNIITVFGTNIFGDPDSDSVIITRGDIGTGAPFINITNENADVPYNVLTYNIGGTNNSHVTGVMNWTNSLTGDNGSIPVSGNDFQVSNINLDIGANEIIVSGTNRWGVYTNDSVIITRGGTGNGNPFINITNVYEMIAYDKSSVSVAGTNNIHVMGEIWWSNTTTSASGNTTRITPGSNSWITSVPLDHGNNQIIVYGTNLLNTVTNDIINIYRAAWDDIQPFINITNENTTVGYNVATYTIGGTNNANVVGMMNWTNLQSGANGNFQLSTFNFQISNIFLVWGPNKIIVYGTNIYGHVTNDYIYIFKYNIDGSGQQSGSKFGRRLPGKLIGWGHNGAGQTNCPAGSDFVAVSGGGDYYSLALKSDGSLVGWGNNDYGKTNCPPGNNFVAVAGGVNHSLALKNDGKLVGWGKSDHGQTNCPAGNNFIAVAAGSYHSLALKSDGKLVGWGYNQLGQTNCPPGSNFVAVAGGLSHSLALIIDGSLVGWGWNNFGQTNCPAGSNFVAIAAGGLHSLALKSDGTLVGWGSNGSGQTNCPHGSDFIAVAAGYYHSLALKNDGTLIGWGSNNMYGETNCPAGSNYITVAGGGSHSLAIYTTLNQPQIATNALIFPSAGVTILAPNLTNIIWDIEKITDEIDGTNLTITKISVHLALTTNEVATVTNDVSNLLGEIPWLVPENLIGNETNYVLKFEVVDSSSLTNSRIFWDNKFTIVPESGGSLILGILILFFWEIKLKLTCGR